MKLNIQLTFSLGIAKLIELVNHGDEYVKTNTL